MATGAAITANARIYMSQFKNKPEFGLYYTDTDSVFLDKPLPNEFVVPKKLGLLKLERGLTNFISLAPKVYGGIDTEGNEFTKVKGFKNKVSLS